MGKPVTRSASDRGATVYAAKARILFLRRARAEPLAYLPRQRRNKRVRDRRRPAETLLRLRSQEPGAEGRRPDQPRIIHGPGVIAESSLMGRPAPTLSTAWRVGSVWRLASAYRKAAASTSSWRFERTRTLSTGVESHAGFFTKGGRSVRTRSRDARRLRMWCQARAIGLVLLELGHSPSLRFL
jgi:hypothetical protein